MRTTPLIASLTLALTLVGCGGNVPGPSPAPDPQPNPVASDGGGVVSPDGQAPLDDKVPPPPPPPGPGNCAPAGAYSGAAQGQIDATIPLLGPQKMPVECVVKYTINGSKAVGTVQVIDPKTKKPWSYAPQPFTFTADVKCNQMKGPLTGNINALGLKIKFTGSVDGTFNGTIFNGKWNGGAVAGVKAQGGGTWSAKQ